MSNEQVLEAFSQILDQEGLEQALAFLNASVPLRYTAVNRYAGLLMKSVGFHDALGEGRPSFLSAIPLDKSLAQFVKPGTPFRTNDSSKDERLSLRSSRGSSSPTMAPLWSRQLAFVGRDLSLRFRPNCAF